MGDLGLKPNIRIGAIIAEQWTIKKKLGEGSCGTVFLLANISNPKAHAAMKVEPLMLNRDDEILKMEVFVLKKMQKSKHACRLFSAGRTNTFSYMIMSLLGQNLSDLRYMMPSKRFTTSTSLRLGKQGLQALKDLHNIGFIHRDVKPLNFSLGSTQSTKRLLFLFDFGLSRQIFLPVQGTNEMKLREPRKKVAFRGTVRYCSLNVHQHKEQGRHDDLISLLYTVVELITGELPWRGLNRRESASIKANLPDRKLFNQCPGNFGTIYSYLKGLEYKDLPSYEFIDKKFDDTLLSKNIKDESPFDWESGGRYFDDVAGKVMTRRSKNPDEQVERDSVHYPEYLMQILQSSTVKEEAPSTEEGPATEGNESEMFGIDKENTLEDLQEIK
uniref:Protein kinase domain-containing protein n=1 Tax=Setaria digitata TaxID=48799 RepID=A0A915PY24_9BILA